MWKTARWIIIITRKIPDTFGDYRWIKLKVPKVTKVS
jgi:hypothetical protein